MTSITKWNRPSEDIKPPIVKGEMGMNLNRVAIYCMDNPSHQMFKDTDGARCVECNGMMMPKPVSEEEYRALPSYSEWREERTRKPKQSISIAVDANTDKLQLKLRAIAKHTVALADELDAIDNVWSCESCGDARRITERNGKEVNPICYGCGRSIQSDSLPTRLEGSE